MIIYIRHSKDNDPETTFKHDNKITKTGKKMAEEKGKRLIEKYGYPEIIHCSPMRRARQTLEKLISSFPEEIRKNIKIYIDPNLSRRFNESEYKRTDLDPKTEKYSPPVVETDKEFKKRIKEHIKYMKENNYKYNGKTYWCITHAIVFKKIAKYNNIKVSDHIDFLQTFKLK